MNGRIVAAFALLAAFAPAGANANVSWTLSGLTFGDGGIATGSFVTSDAGLMQSWHITTSGGALAPETYDSTLGSVLNGATTSTFNLQSDDTTTTMIMLAQNALAAANSPDLVFTNSFEQLGAGTPRYIVAGHFVTGEATPAPEPASVALLASGLAGLALRRRRRN